MYVVDKSDMPRSLLQSVLSPLEIGTIESFHLPGNSSLFQT